MKPSDAARSGLIRLIGLYRRFVSPLLGAHCRFYPSCSAYAQKALATHGLARGGWLAIQRIGRCHPWHPGGIDHVPSATSLTATSLTATSDGTISHRAVQS